VWLTLGNNPDGMHQPRDIPEQGQKDIQPKGPRQADLQENPHWWKYDGNDDSNDVHEILLSFNIPEGLKWKLFRIFGP
jgi:hypothetical protein